TPPRSARLPASPPTSSRAPSSTAVESQPTGSANPASLARPGRTGVLRYPEELMWLDRAVKWLLPREEHFFDLLERGAACALDASGLLVKCCEANDLPERLAIVAKIGDAEHAADQVIHEVYEALNKTFVTPID